MINNRFKKPGMTVISFLIIALFGGFYLYLDISSFIKKPFRPGSPEQTLTILPGQSLKLIAEHLENHSIISNKFYFSVYAKIKKAGKKLQAGEYLLSGSKSPEEILDILVSGRVKLYRITLPEGVTIKEIAGLIQKEGLCDPKKFTALCQNPALIKKLDIQAGSLEGYLFPDTYFFSRQNTCEDMIIAMAGRFKTVFTETCQKRAKELGFSIHEILTLASIIEKETGAAAERPLISSVFHNRLKKKMRLESDPTVIYGIEDFDGNIKKTHLQTRTEYNTYQITGLPPGPIASPGALAIEAALFPDQTHYLFFVSKKDGTHYFSTTYAEHRRAVQKYQLKKAN